MAVVALASAIFVLVEAIGAGTSETHRISMKGVKFVPDTLDVIAGDFVEWTNEDIVPHTATAQDKSFDSGVVEVGKSFRWRATTPGDESYVCTLHPTMTGKVVVKAR